MSKDKYLRLKIGRETEFNWTKTKDDTIIVRDADDGEIFLTIEHALDQKTLISGAYHAGLVTGLNLNDRYIHFLERLTAPLIPGYEEPEYEYALDEPNEDWQVFLSDPRDNEASKYYAYEIFVPKPLAKSVKELCKQMDSQYVETFYSTAAEIWIEDKKSDEAFDAYAAPNKGEPCNIYMNSDLRDLYTWLSNQSHFNIKDLLYTAIKEIELGMTKYLALNANVIPIDAAKQKTDVDNKKPKKIKMTKVQAGSV